MTKQNIMDAKLREMGIVPVVKIDDAAQALPLADALIAGGLPCAEITFRTDAAADAIRQIRENRPDMLVGAGTVLTLEQLEKAVEAGSQFIVSPGMNPEIVKAAQVKGLPIYPGCATPTEVEAAMALGLRTVKFFPAEAAGGTAMLSSLAAPYSQIKFMPTGGVNAANVKEYIDAPFIHAVGGSWVCPKADIAAGNFEKITALCKEARAAAFGE